MKKLSPGDLKQMALERGATRAEVIPASHLVIKQAARMRCYIPLCHWYGSSVMCPPHNPLTPDRTREIVAEYRQALIFQMEFDPRDLAGDEWVERHRPRELRHKDLVGELESAAFYGGYPLAMGFAAGECSYCLPKHRCSVLEGDRCRHPLRARPSMEACGFDVFAIAHRLGWPLVPIGASSRPEELPCASLIGLVLLE